MNAFVSDKPWVIYSIYETEFLQSSKLNELVGYVDACIFLDYLTYWIHYPCKSEEYIRPLLHITWNSILKYYFSWTISLLLYPEINETFLFAYLRNLC